jgi:prepilin-type N-terminal cleavage/methylation domain-containing protein
LRGRIRRATSGGRAGFTLVELLAALGISLLLIAAVTASLNIYVRLTATGEFSVERQQVTRALLEQMTRDVSSIVFTPPESEEDPDEEVSTTEPEPVEIEDATSSISSASVGLIGDSQSLVLNVSRPSRNLGYTSPLAAASLNERTSDLLSVSYFLASPGEGGLRGAVADNAAGYVTTTSSMDGNGLARLEGDRMAIDYADLQTDTELLAGAARLIAPEVVSLQFRYFDGAAWFDVWDSTASGALPQAIEVTLGFRPLIADEEAPQLSSSVPEAEDYVRHVIHVPIAEPYSASSTY